MASKGVDFTSDIWPSRSLKVSLQNIKLMLDLLHHKCNSLLTTVVDGSIFKKICKTIHKRKMLEEDITFTQVLQ